MEDGCAILNPILLVLIATISSSIYFQASRIGTTITQHFSATGLII
jgi:hypothetical protein